MNPERTVLACLALSLVAALASPVWAQDAQAKKITQTAGVDNSRMGAYRALAQMAYQAFERKDNATAAELARVLERTWDRGESGERAAGKPNANLYNEIDKIMDGFIGPMINYSPKAPVPAAVEAAYKNYLNLLSEADQLP